MAIGQVSFHKDKVVRRFHIAARDNAIVNRLNKTKGERGASVVLLQRPADAVGGQSSAKSTTKQTASSASRRWASSAS